MKDNYMMFNSEERKILNSIITFYLRSLGFWKPINDYNLRLWSNEKQRFLEYA